MNKATRTPGELENEDEVTSELSTTKLQMTRSWIFEKGLAINGKPLERVMGQDSMIPTNNVFSNLLNSFGFNIFIALVVDLLHEFELGVWKAVFTNLIRILFAFGQDTVQELNKRCRCVSTFSGRDTIHRFSDNVSEITDFPTNTTSVEKLHHAELDRLAILRRR